MVAAPAWVLGRQQPSMAVRRTTSQSSLFSVGGYIVSQWLKTLRPRIESTFLFPVALLAISISIRVGIMFVPVAVEEREHGDFAIEDGFVSSDAVHFYGTYQILLVYTKVRSKTGI